MLNEVGLTRGDVIRFSLLPQIFPRVKRLLGSGFTILPFYIMAVFNTLRIIPNNHPYLRRDKIGTYSTIQAMAAAANHITFDRKNIDKIAIFGVILTGLVMMLLQIIMCVIALFTAPAYAYQGPGLGPRTMGAFFDNATPDTDIAFRLLDLIFGIPGIFTGAAETTPFHAGLHALFEFYSYGILLVGTFVIIYLVICVVLETADSGIPFGQRFNKAWAPFRIVLFFGLLLPTGNGINMAQYMLLNAAKLGSNVATNAWILFDTTAETPYIATADQLIARPAEPDLSSLASFLAIAKTCSWAEGREEQKDIQGYLVFGKGVGNAVNLNALPAFADIVQRAAGGAVFIRFGVQDAVEYKDEPGAVYPYCGELSLTINDQGQPGAAFLQQAYLETIACHWNNAQAGEATCTPYPYDDVARFFAFRYGTVFEDGQEAYPDPTGIFGAEPKAALLNGFNDDLRQNLDTAVQRQREQGDWTNAPAMQLGWAGAGIWFNKIAQQNGAITIAVMGIPSIKLMPSVMEYVKGEKQKEDARVALKDLYKPVLADNKLLTFDKPEQERVARILDKVYTYWNLESSNMAQFAGRPDSGNLETSGNIIIDTMNAFMGTRGLFDMCANTDIHPLAQLASMGSGMVEHAIRAFGLAAGVGLGGGLMALLDKQNYAQALGGASSMLMTFASIGLLLGVILYYVLPFVPFIYFFFAVMTWVKAIFEAMVGMPLWALAHLRIDGQGMPGDAGTNGYMYIFEIFLRPVCIIISFLGGIMIFAAMVKVLNSIFFLVISNLTGHYVDPAAGAAAGINCFAPPGGLGAGAGGGAGAGAGPQQLEFARGVIDQFFYTVIYAVMVYMIGLPCFKLVDIIPDNIMRWFGTSISAFGSEDGDPAEGLMRNVSVGAGLIGKSLQSGLGGAVKAFK